MTIQKTTDPDQVAKKRGPKPSGVPRTEVFKKASKTHRSKMISDGKVELKTFVGPGTKEILARLKIAYGLETVGEVIDALAQQVEKKSL